MDQPSDLWIDIEIEGEQIPRPVATREQLLPLQSLSWENFERLCYRLALRTGDAEDCRRYGTLGQEQHGIDLYVRRTLDARYATWQCKRQREFTPADLERAVDKFLTGKWATRSQIFHLAVSISLVPTVFAEAVEVEAQKCRAHQIEFVPLDLDRLSEMLKPHADLVDDFFGRTWVEAFCGLDATLLLSGRKLRKPNRLKARRMLRELYATHFATVDVGLPAAAPRFRFAAHPLPLHIRYVPPMVEVITSVLELAAEPRSSVATDQLSSHGEGTERTPDSRDPFALRVREQRTQWDLFTWLVSADRAVLLGGPGLGKSASLRFAAIDLLLDQPHSEGLARKWGGYLPLFLPFAFLTRMLAENEVVSIPDCFSGWLHKLSARPEEVALLEEALKDERLLLLLDGLDEWSDATSAQTARLGLFAPLTAEPLEHTQRRLIGALFNCTSDIERKQIAEGVSHWPDFVGELLSLATQAQEPELLAAMVHAVALGWPAQPAIADLLRQASESPNEDIRCVALIHRANRGDNSPVVKSRLAAFCYDAARPYPWENELLDVLAKQWPRDEELRTEALQAAPKRFAASKWNPRMALRYLLKAYPGDNDVAEIIAETLRREEHISATFDRLDSWEDGRAGFAAHPTVVPAAEQWLERHYKADHNEMDVAEAAMLGRSARCKAFLIERLKAGRGLPIWPVKALIELVGPNDAEVREAVSPYLVDEKQAGWLGRFLPDFVHDREACRKRLLQLLETGKGSVIGHLIWGLLRLDALTEEDTLRLIERRLEADLDRNFWWSAKYTLIPNLPHHPLVRRLALLDLNDEEASLSSIAATYANDPEFRPQLEALLEPLHHDLRLTIVRALRGFALRTDDAFALNLLGEYAAEWDAETRTAAADAYYTAARKSAEDPTVYLERLKQELTTTGPYFTSVIKVLPPVCWHSADHPFGVTEKNRRFSHPSVRTMLGPMLKPLTNYLILVKN